MKFKVRGIDTFASTGGRPFDKNKPLIIFVHGSGLSHMGLGLTNTLLCISWI